VVLLQVDAALAWEEEVVEAGPEPGEGAELAPGAGGWEEEAAAALDDGLQG
jgi:hypothetical protein